MIKWRRYETFISSLHLLSLLKHSQSMQSTVTLHVLSHFEQAASTAYHVLMKKEWPKSVARVKYMQKFEYPALEILNIDSIDQNEEDISPEDEHALTVLSKLKDQSQS